MEYLAVPCIRELLDLDRFQLGVWENGISWRAEEEERKTDQMDANYNFTVIALKALTAYQPRDYQFNLQDRRNSTLRKYRKTSRS